MNGRRDLIDGGFSSFDQLISLRRISKRRYINDDVNSAKDVAAAAPDAPSPVMSLFMKMEVGAPTPLNPNIHNGSSTRFNKFVVNDTFKGVTVFNNPLYAAKPVAENKAGIIPSALHLKYGTA